MLMNLTPHQINIVSQHGIYNIPPSGIVARCKQQEKFIGGLENDIPVTKIVVGEVQDLLASEPGITYIVSHIILQNCPERCDLVKPEQIVRAADGRVIGCCSLSVL